MRRAARQLGGRRGDPGIVALLSLKLLLLGFFILLNALSQFEDQRARQVLESVNEAFNGRVQASERHAPVASGLGALEQTRAMIRTVDRLFRSLIPAVRSEVSASGGHLLLELPAETLFQPAGVPLQPGRDLLLRRFAMALADEGRIGLDYEVELLHGVPDGALATRSAAPSGGLEVRRLGALARQLVRLGVPAKKLSVALLPGRPGKVQLVVQAYDGPLGAPDYREFAQ
jgi:hypothetical protein